MSWYTAAKDLLGLYLEHQASEEDAEITWALLAHSRQLGGRCTAYWHIEVADELGVPHVRVLEIVERMARNGLLEDKKKNNTSGRMAGWRYFWTYKGWELYEALKVDRGEAEDKHQGDAADVEPVKTDI